MVNALVVEDEEDIRQLLVDELEGKGYQVQEASDGVIALQRVREQLPDIIFVDVMLPVMDGFGLISKLRERKETAKIPVVLVTALNARDTEVRARRLGVKHHLTKPWEPWALDFVLGQALKPDCFWSKEEAKYQVYPPKVAVPSDLSGSQRG